jgi:DNA polymerase-3 subunit alpha
VVAAELQKLGVIKYKNVSITKKDQKLMIAGLVISIKSLQTKKGDRMAVAMMDDGSNQFEVTIFPDPYQKFRDLLIKDQLLIIEGSAANDTYSGALKVRANTVYTLELARENFAKRIIIDFKQVILSEELVNKLKDCLAIQERGNCAIYIEYKNDEAMAKIKLDPKWNMKATSKALQTITTLLNNSVVEVEY